MKKYVILISLMIMFSSCFPLHQEYFQPTADKGEVGRTPYLYDAGQGPRDSICFGAGDDVTIGLQAYPQGKFSLALRLVIYVPKGSSARFEDDIFIIQDLVSREAVKQKLISLTYYDNDPVTDIENRKIKPSSVLQGNTLTTSKREYYRHFNGEIKFEGVDFEAFKLICPPLKINEKPYEIPEVIYNRKIGWFLYSI